MSGNALENAGTIASGGTLVVGSLAWIEINSTALSVIIMAFTAVMTAGFYLASLRLKREEIRDKVKDDLIDEFFEKISNVEADTHERVAAKQMLEAVLNRRE